MKETVAIFKSKNDTQSFFYALKRYGIKCRIVSTPVTVAHSCGISVLFDKTDLIKAEKVLKSGRFYSFIGFYNL